METLLTLAEVEKHVSFKRTKIYSLMKEGLFPESKKYHGSVRWWASQIDYYIRNEGWDDDGWKAEIETKAA